MTTLLPSAEYILDVGIRRAVRILREGGNREDAERTLSLALAAAVLLDRRETLEP